MRSPATSVVSSARRHILQAFDGPTSGPISISQTIQLDRLEELAGHSAEKIESLFLPAREAVEFEAVSIDDETACAVEVGKKLSADTLDLSDCS